MVTISDVVKDIYHGIQESLGNYSPAYAGVGNMGTYSTPISEDSKLEHISFMSRHGGKKDQGKGGGHLHQGNHVVEMKVNGKIVHIDKNSKPANITLTAWICEQFRLSHKQATQIVKRFH